MKEGNKMNFAIADAMSYNPTLNIEKEDSKGYYTWGASNDYPGYLFDIYSNCATLQSIINGCTDYTVGDGVVFDPQLKSLKWENEDGDTLEEVVSKLILDRWIFGGFAFQVIYNPFHDINEIVYLDFRKVRTNKKGTEIWYSDGWGKWGQGGKNKAILYPCFDPEKTDEFNQVFYYKGNKTRSVYPVPDYAASLVSAETQIEIQKFHYSTILNNFMVNGILNFNNGVPEQDVQDKIESMVNEKFSGTTNAARLMIAFNEDQEKASTFERVSSDDFDDKYQALSSSTRENLFVSMRAMPQLFGLNYDSGFSAVEYQDAFALFNKVQINPVQREMTRVFDKVFGIENSVTFKPLTIEFPTNEKETVTI